MSTIDDLVIGIGIEAGELDAQVDEAASRFESNIKRISLAGATAGAGLEAFARGQADSNAQTRELAASLGMSEDAMRTLAGETANVGFPLNEVLDIMETGKQRGLKSAEALKAYASTWDMIGDATGENATELAKAGTALQTMGIGAGEEEKALAALGFVQEHTTMTQADFLGMVGRLGPDLAKAGLDIDDTAALLGAMEQELGLTGRAARTELTSALKESDGTFSDLIDTLGISETSLNGYADAVENSSGVLERNSDIVDQGFTPLQKLQNQAKELMYNYGDLAQVAGMAAPVLMAIGPAIKGVSVAIDIGSKAVKGLSAAMTFLAANPVVLVIAILVALVAAIVVAYKNSETFRKIVDAAFRAVGAAATWLWKNALEPAFKAIGAVVMWLWNNAMKPTFALIKAGWDLLVSRIRQGITTWRAIFSAIGQVVSDWWNRAKDIFNTVVLFVKGIPGKIKSAFSSLASAIASPFKAGFNAVARAWNSTVGQLSFTIPSWIPGIGGNSWSAPQLPYFHKGGIVPGPRGAEVLGVLQGGERVLPLGSEGGGGVITLRSDGSALADLVVQMVANAVRNLGPGAIGIKAAAA